MELPIDLEVLNATSDDWESLEQIYRSISLEFSAKHYDANNRDSFYWRERVPPKTLAAIADSTLRLLKAGLLIGRMEDGTAYDTESTTPLWQYWFRPSASGRAVLQEFAESPFP